MNERIRELDKETWQNVAELGQVRWSDWRDEFAKLIVRECAKVANGGWADPGYQIKTHFGVE
jgi:hypothetical protein